jgi:hypothetical protein
MSPGTRGFVAGFAVAIICSLGVELYRTEQAALKRVELEAALAARGEDLSATRRALAGLRDRAARLSADSGRLSVSLAGARRARDEAQQATAELAARLRAAGDTGGANVVERGEAAGAAERQACSLVVVNCEARAAAADTARLLAEAELDSTAVLLQRTAGQWRDAERRAQPSFFRDVMRAKAVVAPLVALLLYQALSK